MFDDDGGLRGVQETEDDPDDEGTEEVLWQHVLHEIHLKYREKNRHIKLCCQESGKMQGVYKSVLLDEGDAIAEQPPGLRKQLKPHQRTAVSKMIQMERHGILRYELPDEKINIEEATVGILADRAGYGKTITMLALMASNDEIHQPRSQVIRNHSQRWGHSYVMRRELPPDTELFVDTTLVLVPHGPVFKQWLDTIQENTDMKLLALRKACDLKDIPADPHAAAQYLASFDVVLVTGTEYPKLRDRFSAHLVDVLERWKRVVVDEADSIATGQRRMTGITSRFAWFITASPDRLYNLAAAFYVRQTWTQPYIDRIRKYITVRNSDEYVARSFSLPSSRLTMYLCGNMARVNLNALKHLVPANIMNMLNANDYGAAVACLGGQRGEDLLAVMANDVSRRIHDIKLQISCVEQMGINERDKALRLQRLRDTLESQENRFRSIQERLTGLDDKTCSMCLNTVEQPVSLACTHVFCGSCIMQWIDMKLRTPQSYGHVCSGPTCPECRTPIEVAKMIRLGGGPPAQTEDKPEHATLKTKDARVMEIVQANRGGRYLVFAEYEGAFANLKELFDREGITNKQLKGHSAQQNRTLEDFKSGRINVIMLNSRYAGSGIDIHFATDVILYQLFSDNINHQVVGRAQRVGRSEALNVHQLYHENEILDSPDLQRQFEGRQTVTVGEGALQAGPSQ